MPIATPSARFETLDCSIAVCLLISPVLTVSPCYILTEWVAVVNILTDVLFATMPIPLVWQLQLNTRTKLSLITILSLGYL